MAQDLSKLSKAQQSALSIAEAKANFSSLIAEVEQKQTAVTISRHGIPVAQVIPFTTSPRHRLSGSMAGTAQKLGDIVSPPSQRLVNRRKERATETETSIPEESHATSSRSRFDQMFGRMKGTFTIVGDIVSPDHEAWKRRA